MNILVINAGSSSLKYQLLNPATGELLAKGLCERIGIAGKFTYKPQVEGKEKLDAIDVAMPTHAEAIQAVLDALVDNSDKPEPIFVSWESLEARKKELEELVNVKIPENLHNKKISRAEGDLRENGGYQDAKEVEKVLNRRRAELEHALALARGTDFAVTDTSRAAMGTKVTLQPLNGGEPVVYTILGAWDTNPEKHIVSYLSQVGKELTGKSVGDQVKIVPMDGDKKKVYTITKIEAAF